MEKLNFETVYRKHERFYTNPGDSIYIEYEPTVDDNGVIVLKEVGKRNLYDEIQSHRDSVDIHKIIDRAKRGELELPSGANALFADVSVGPKSYRDALDKIYRAVNVFDALPVEIKQKFNNSASEFVSSFGTDKFAKIFGLNEKVPVVEPVVDDVKEVIDNEEL